MEKKKPAPRKTKKSESAETELSQVLAALKKLGVIPPQEEATTEPEEEVKVEPVAPEAPVVQEEPPAAPANVRVEVPDFETVFIVGRKKGNRQLFSMAYGEVDAVVMSGLIDYSIKLKDRLWTSMMAPKE